MSDLFSGAGDRTLAPARLSDLTTIRLGGPAGRFTAAATTDALIDAVIEADRGARPLLLVGGGSNLLVADDGFAGDVVHVATGGTAVESDDACSGVTLRVAAGHPWDDLVRTAVSKGWSGLEALSGIPGSVGATPVQNVGAYGAEVAQSIASVRTWDRQDRRVKTFAAADCDFAYRTSLFKHERAPGGGPRYVILEVTLQLRPADLSAPVSYPELAARLGGAVGERAPLTAVREAVLALRRSKGMVLDPADHDTWSLGSFFTNPLLPPDVAGRLPHDAPRYPGGPGLVKTSAAWLIEHAGYGKGYGLPGAVSLSTKHTLALTNRGSASTADVLALAREVRDGVAARFGVRLEPEPILVGCSL